MTTTRRLHRHWATVGILALAAVAGCSPGGTPAAHPETVVVVSIDTTRRDHLSVYGYPRPTSPFLEVLAEDAVVFDQAVAVHTNTAPAHASILTGLYPPQHGSINNAVPIFPEVPTLAEALTAVGFDTAAFVSGKTLKAGECGLDRGFRRYDDRFRGWERRAEATLSRARRWLEGRDRNRSIFLFFHLFDPHFLYSPPTPFNGFGLAAGETARAPTSAERLRASARRDTASWRADIAEWTRRYDGEIAYADWVVGQLIATLQQLDRYAAAIIVVVSDHGETLGERPRVLDHGGRVTEEQLLVPLIVKLPDGDLAGARINTQVSQIDIAPTILQTLGLPPLPATPGIDLREIAQNLDATERPLFAMARREPGRLTDLGFPVPDQRGWNAPESMLVAVRLPPYKLVDYGFGSGTRLRRLRDLEHDPGESSFTEAPETEQRYGRLLDDWWRRHYSADARPGTPLSEESVEMLEALGYLDPAGGKPAAIFRDGFDDGDVGTWTGVKGSSRNGKSPLRTAVADDPSAAARPATRSR